jgi:hypothetical protein
MLGLAGVKRIPRFGPAVELWWKTQQVKVALCFLLFLQSARPGRGGQNEQQHEHNHITPNPFTRWEVCACVAP